MIVGQSEQGLRGLLEAVPEAIVVVNQKGEILLANTRTKQMFGYCHDELLGCSVGLLVPEPLFERYIRQGTECYAYQAESLELQARRKDGSVFPVEINVSPFETEDGLLLASAIRDATQRKQTEMRLRQNEERLRLLIEEVKDYAIFMLDPEGRIASWNKGAERIRGYRAEEIIGRHFSCFYTPEDVKAGRPQEVLEEALAEGRVEIEGWRVRKDGSRFWANVVLTALKDKEGRLVGFTKVAHDITQSKRAREALLLEVSNLLFSKLDVRDLFSAISSSLRQINECDYAGLALYDPDIRKLRVYALPSPAGKDLIHEEILLPLENSPAGWAFKARKPVVLNQIHEDGRPFEIPANLIAQGIKSISRVPLISRDRVLGTLNLGSWREGAFTDEDVSLLIQIANQIAVAIDNAMAFRQLSQLKERLAEEKSYLEDEIRTKFNFAKSWVKAGY
jgi:formate hydrogenlyase transcriptional activator